MRLTSKPGTSSFVRKLKSNGKGWSATRDATLRLTVRLRWKKSFLHPTGSEIERHPGLQAQAGALAREVQEQAVSAYALWIADPHHPGLSFKLVNARSGAYSVRIGLGYRALGFLAGDRITWFWIGSHADYDALLNRV